MHECRAIGYNINALADEPVNDAANGLFIPGDGPRREDDGVARRKGNVRMLVFGNPGQSRAWLALAAGKKRHDLVPWQIAIGF